MGEWGKLHNVELYALQAAVRGDIVGLGAGFERHRREHMADLLDFLVRTTVTDNYLII